MFVITFNIVAMFFFVNIGSHYFINKEAIPFLLCIIVALLNGCNALDLFKKKFFK